MNKKLLWTMIRETVNEFFQDRATRLAAATAYYAIFSIGPLLVLTIGVAGVVFGEETVRREVVDQIRSFVGNKSANLISSMMSVQRNGDSLMATIIGATALVIGATGAFGQLQDSLNTIWGVTVKPGKSMWAFLRDRFFSMAMVLVVGFLLLVSMALSAVVVAFAKYIGDLIAIPAWLVPLFNDGLNFVVISLLFALIFKVLPDVKIRWRDVWVGAVLTALLFTIGKFLLGVYLARETSASAYGAGSAFVVILLYIYFASLILYLGAEFTQVYARYHGSKFEPSTYAVHITDFERAEQGMARQARIEEASRRDRPHPVAQTALEISSSAAAPQLVGKSSENNRLAIEPWHFMGLAFVVGAAAGLLWRSNGNHRSSASKAATRGRWSEPCPQLGNAST